MKQHSFLRLSTRETQFTAVIEPWAEEFVVSPGECCVVVALNPVAPPTFDVELYRGVLVVSVLESGSTYEFWRDKVLEFHTTIPIPEWPPS